MRAWRGRGAKTHIARLKRKRRALENKLHDLLVEKSAETGFDPALLLAAARHKAHGVDAAVRLLSEQPTFIPPGPRMSALDIARLNKAMALRQRRAAKRLQTWSPK
jgi:hypothetical protein